MASVEVLMQGWQLTHSLSAMGLSRTSCTSFCLSFRSPSTVTEPGFSPSSRSMLRYVDNEAETANTLRRHDDGRIWLHSGDLGKMDEDGFVYFSQRIKRMNAPPCSTLMTSSYSCPARTWSIRMVRGR